MTENYMPREDCPVCGGHGFVHPVVDGKVDYSRVVPCSAPGCLLDSIQAYKRGEPFIRQKGIRLKQTFENFQVVRGSEEAYAAAKAFAERTCKEPFLLIFGRVGNGKTHLCEAAALTLSYDGIDCRLFTVPDLLSELRQAISDNTIEDKVAELKSILVLILDDFGAEYQSDWALARLFEIIDFRYREELPLMMTTNYDLNQLPERIVSRFSDTAVSRMVLNNAKDFRRKSEK